VNEKKQQRALHHFRRAVSIGFT
jgi:hypothetical protein